MESESGDIPPVDAAAQLRSHDDMRAKVERRGPSGAFASLMLWGALVTAVYSGVFLFALGGRPIDEQVSGSGSFPSTALLLFPILVFSALVSGARERFSVHLKPALGYWIFSALVLAGFGALAILTLVGVVYPWWLNLIVPVALFVVMAADPIRRLRGTAKTPEDERWVNERLSRPARRNTALIGAATGLLAATSTQQWFPLLAMATFLMLIVMTLAFSASWGLPRTGYEWGPLHWSALGVTLGVLFLLALLLARTTWVTTPIAVIAGVFAFAVMLGASVLPRSPKQ